MSEIPYIGIDNKGQIIGGKSPTDVILTPEQHQAEVLKGLLNKPKCAPNPGPGYWWIRIASAGHHDHSSGQSNDYWSTWDYGVTSMWDIARIEDDHNPPRSVDVFGSDEGLTWDMKYAVVVEVGPKIEEPKE